MCRKCPPDPWTIEAVRDREPRSPLAAHHEPLLALFVRFGCSHTARGSTPLHQGSACTDGSYLHSTGADAQNRCVKTPWNAIRLGILPQNLRCKYSMCSLLAEQIGKTPEGVFGQRLHLLRGRSHRYTTIFRSSAR